MTERKIELFLGESPFLKCRDASAPACCRDAFDGIEASFVGLDGAVLATCAHRVVPDWDCGGELFKSNLGFVCLGEGFERACVDASIAVFAEVGFEWLVGFEFGVGQQDGESLLS